MFETCGLALEFLSPFLLLQGTRACLLKRYLLTLLVSPTAPRGTYIRLRCSMTGDTKKHLEVGAVGILR